MYLFSREIAVASTFVAAFVRGGSRKPQDLRCGTMRGGTYRPEKAENKARSAQENRMNDRRARSALSWDRIANERSSTDRRLA